VASISFPSLDASSCMSFMLFCHWCLDVNVGDVLTLLKYSFRAGLGVAGSSVFSSIGVSSNHVSLHASLLCFLVTPRFKGSPKVAYL
jgi:hypothetical protein